MKKRNRILVALLAAISVLTAGCSGEIEQNPIGLEQEESQAEASADASESTTENEKAPDMLASQKKLYNQNKDTIGWIEVPGTPIIWTKISAIKNSVPERSLWIIGMYSAIRKMNSQKISCCMVIIWQIIPCLVLSGGIDRI